MPERDTKQSGMFLPATFAQRGVAVAFSTPVLSFARLRRTRDDTLQYLVPGLSGGIETYVIPAVNIADVVNLTVYDRHIMESIDGDRINLSPLAMRNITLKKATSGLAGAKRAKRARALIQMDRENNVQMLLLLIQTALEQLGDQTGADAAGNLTENALQSGKAVTCLQDHLGSFLAETGLTAEQAFARFQKWAACTSMVGSPDDKVVGVLKQLIRDLERMADELLSWLVPEPVGPAEMAQRVAVAAKQAVAEARKVQEFIDDSFTDIGPPLHDWTATKPALREAARRMAEILDGWRRIVDRWDRVSDRERIDQREIVELFGLYMPVLPIEAVGQNTAFWEDIRATQKRWERDAASAARSLLDVDEKVQDKLHKYQKEVA